MPETYANPYAVETPLGSALKRLSSAITSGPDEATRLYRAEQALKTKRQNENTIALGDVFRNYGEPAFDRRAAMDLAIRAGYDPAHLAQMERYGSANTFGATDPRTTNAFVGAGGAYGSTADGFEQTQANQNARHAASVAEQRYQFDNKPMTVSGESGPVIMRQSEAYGRPAVEDLGKVKGDVARRAYVQPGGLEAANQATRQFIGVEGKGQPTPRNYVVDGKSLITYDGVTEASSGQPLPAGGYIATAQGAATDVGLRPNVQGDLQKASIAGQRFRAMLNFTRNIAKQSDENFSLPGFVKGAFQDAAAISGNVAKGLGYNGVQDAVNTIRQKATQSGVDPGLLSGVFDPSLPALHTSADLLVYAAAEALAGQSGRSVTDRDIKIFKQIAGDPREWFSNQEKYLAKLDTMEQILNLQQEVVDQNLRRESPATPAAPGASQPGFPAAAPGAPSTPVKRYNPATGEFE